jgi:hypothetical protein
MNNDHIIELLDRAPISELGELDLARVREHNRDCAECREAFLAAKISQRLLQQRVSTVIEPTPFFKTRVMAEIREKKEESSSFSPSWMWKNAQKLVYSMAALVVLLLAINFYQSDPQPETQSAGYSDLMVLGTNPDAIDELTYDQLLIGYDADEDESNANR